MQRLYLLMANAILVAHALIVLFNVGALPVIWVGHFRGWRFVRNFSFRAVHLLLIGYVAGESLVGAICPLTTWEDDLRLKAGVSFRYQRGCLTYWLHRLIFYNLDERFFTVAYGIFFALVVLTLVWVKPRSPAWWGRKT